MIGNHFDKIFQILSHLTSSSHHYLMSSLRPHHPSELLNSKIRCPRFTAEKRRSQKFGSNNCLSSRRNSHDGAIESQELMI